MGVLVVFGVWVTVTFNAVDVVAEEPVIRFLYGDTTAVAVKVDTGAEVLFPDRVGRGLYRFGEVP